MKKSKIIFIYLFIFIMVILGVMYSNGSFDEVLTFDNVEQLDVSEEVKQIEQLDEPKQTDQATKPLIDESINGLETIISLPS